MVAWVPEVFSCSCVGMLRVGRKPKPRVAKQLERVTVKTSSKPESAQKKLLAPRLITGRKSPEHCHSRMMPKGWYFWNFARFIWHAVIRTTNRILPSNKSSEDKVLSFGRESDVRTLFQCLLWLCLVHWKSPLPDTLQTFCAGPFLPHVPALTTSAMFSRACQTCHNFPHFPHLSCISRFHAFVKRFFFYEVADLSYLSKSSNH